MKGRSVVVLLAVLALVLTGCTGHDAVEQGAGGQFRFVSATKLGTTWKPADREKAGNLTAQRLTGPGTLSLRQYAGKIVVVNYWASWCAPCRIETPQFNTLYRQYKAQGVVFLGVDFKEHSRQGGQVFVQEHDISYPMVYDQIGKTALQLGDVAALALPFTILIDQHQRVAAVYADRVHPDELKHALGTLLAEPAQPTAEGGH